MAKELPYGKRTKFYEVGDVRFALACDRFEFGGKPAIRIVYPGGKSHRVFNANLPLCEAGENCVWLTPRFPLEALMCLRVHHAVKPTGRKLMFGFKTYEEYLVDYSKFREDATGMLPVPTR